MSCAKCTHNSSQVYFPSANYLACRGAWLSSGARGVSASRILRVCRQEATEARTRWDVADLDPMTVVLDLQKFQAALFD